jgi:hypothetical protein
MVIIVLPNDTDWFYANWVFRQLASDVVTRYPDRDICETLEQAAAVGMLDLKAMDDEKLVEKLITALRDVAEDTVNGALSPLPADHSGAKMYRETMAELVTKIDKNCDT